jgi:hypothetical protein
MTRRLVTQQLEDDAKVDPSTLSLCLMAVNQLDDLFENDPVPRQLRDSLKTLFDTEAEGLRLTDDRDLSATSRSLVLAALSSDPMTAGDVQVKTLLRKGIDEFWQDGQPNLNAFAMPWVAACLLNTENSSLNHEDAQAESIEDRRASLLQFVDVISQAQIVERPELGPYDVQGGIPLRQAPFGTPPNPDWHTAEMLMFIALMLRMDDGELIRDTFGAILTAESAARFIGQLMVDQPSTFAMPHPPAALGGVRLTLWDNRLDVLPTAMSLIALIELQESLRKLHEQLDQN